MYTKKQWTLTAVALACTWGWVCAGPASAADDVGFADQVGADPAVAVSNFDTVQLNVQATDLSSVLQLLSVQSRRNIVPSTKVSGQVTANLYDVTFHEALDAILQQNGCGYVEKGNFIFVYTLEELKEIQQAERRVTYKVVRLNYITATDASTFITPLLSSAGTIAISGNVAAGMQPTVGDAGADSFADVHTMVLRDYPENIDEILKVIKQLDVKPKQVLVEATILQADITENTAFGVDFSILTNLAVDTFTKPLGAITETISGTTPAALEGGNWGGVTSSVGNVEGGDGGVRFGVVTGNIAAFVRALDSVTDTVILANPKVMVVNRQRAEVHVGQKVGYLSTTATATATTQTVEFLDVGTKLILRPFVSDDGFVRLELQPSISEAQIRNVIPGTSTAAVTIPDEITQELTTNVMVRDGQTVVLGGLFREETTVSRNQVPVLGDLPVVGNAFKGRDDSVGRDEVIFLITPHVVKDEAVEMAGATTRDSIEMVRVGARQGLLPWSRSKMTAAHLRDALRYVEANDREMAMWEVDLALGMNPAQKDALRLKEKLTGQREFWPGNSLMDEAVHMIVEQQTGKRKQDKRVRPFVPDTRPYEPGHNDPLFGEPDAKLEPAILDVQPALETAGATAVEVDIDEPVVERDAAPSPDGPAALEMDVVEEQLGTTDAPADTDAPAMDGNEAVAVPLSATDDTAASTPSALSIQAASSDQPAVAAAEVKPEAKSTPIVVKAIGPTDREAQTKSDVAAEKPNAMPAVLRAAIEEYRTQINGAEAGAKDDDRTASVDTEDH